MVRSGTNKEIKKDYLFPFKMVMQEKSRVLNHGYYLIYLFTLIYTQLVLEMYFYKSDFCLTVDLLSYLTMWPHTWNRLPLHACSVNIKRYELYSNKFFSKKIYVFIPHWLLFFVLKYVLVYKRITSHAIYIYIMSWVHVYPLDRPPLWSPTDMLSREKINQFELFNIIFN